MNEDQLRAKALVLFHSLVSNWAADLRGDVTRLQEHVNHQLDSLQETMAKYEENIDEQRILSFVDEIGQTTGGADGGDGLDALEYRGGDATTEHAEGAHGVRFQGESFVQVCRGQFCRPYLPANLAGATGADSGGGAG